jgi:hypothetical protein
MRKEQFSARLTLIRPVLVIDKDIVKGRRRELSRSSINQFSSGCLIVLKKIKNSHFFASLPLIRTVSVIDIDIGLGLFSSKEQGQVRAVESLRHDVSILVISAIFR